MKQITHDDLRTRLCLSGVKNIALLEERMSCYEDCECQALKEQVAELKEQVAVLDKYPRAAKLMKYDSEFLVIKCSEPYAAAVASLIREHEQSKGTWTADDAIWMNKHIVEKKPAQDHTGQTAEEIPPKYLSFEIDWNDCDYPVTVGGDTCRIGDSVDGYRICAYGDIEDAQQAIDSNMWGLTSTHPISGDRVYAYGRYYWNL